MPGVDAQGRTPLHYAALADDTAAVRTLLSQGADPDAADRQGFTALHFAAQQGAISAAAALLAAGAQVDAVNSHGNTPLFTASGMFSSATDGELLSLSDEVSPGRSTSLPLTNFAPARTSATRWAGAAAAPAELHGATSWGNT